jgi:hypothetical protein
MEDLSHTQDNGSLLALNEPPNFVTLRSNANADASVILESNGQDSDNSDDQTPRSVGPEAPSGPIGVLDADDENPSQTGEYACPIPQS